jgi:hypothetical protein
VLFVVAIHVAGNLDWQSRVGLIVETVRRRGRPPGIRNFRTKAIGGLLSKLERDGRLNPEELILKL